MASSRDPWRAPQDPNQYALDNPGTTDLQEIGRKVQAGIVLTPAEQQMWDAQQREIVARTRGGGGSASNGAAGTGAYQTGLGPLITSLPDPAGRKVPGFENPNPGITPTVPSGGGGSSNDMLQQILQMQKDNLAKNQAYVSGHVDPAIAQRDSDTRFAQQGQADALGTYIGQSNNYKDLLGGIGVAGFANAGSANASGQKTLADLGSVYDSMKTPLTAGGYGADVQAEHAALERAGFQTADLTTAQVHLAATALAASNSGDVQAEKTALAQLKSMAGGSLDVQNGGLTPEAKAAQLKALGTYGELSASPEVTGQERLIYETARVEQERQEKASRDALMNEYRAKGVGNSSMELASILGGGQQASENRLLSDLGAQATAVQRQMAALAGYGGLSTDMMQQGNQVALGNAGNRLGAAGAQGQLAATIRGQGDTMSMFNTGQTNQMAAFNAGQQNTVGMFNAGQANQNAQFNANAYNTNQMFNTGQANTVSMFNTGQDNAMAQFNKEQSQISQRWQEGYAANERDALAKRSQDFADTSLGENNLGYNRTSNALNGFANLAGLQHETDTGINDRTSAYWGGVKDDSQNAVGNALNQTNAWTGVTLPGQAATTGAARDLSGNAQLQAAIASLKKDDKGPFGFVGF